MNSKQVMIALTAALMVSVSSGVMAGHHDEQPAPHGVQQAPHGGQQAQYGGQQQRYDYARVTNVEPIYRTVRINAPRQECWDEERTTYNQGYQSGTPTIIGGLIGGAIGNQFGKGHGKDVATIAGALLGGSIARDQQNKNHGGGHATTRYETACRTVNDYQTEERIEGYQVSYKYRGQIYTSRMNREPGDRVRVQVQVSLAE